MKNPLNIDPGSVFNWGVQIQSYRGPSMKKCMLPIVVLYVFSCVSVCQCYFFTHFKLKSCQPRNYIIPKQIKEKHLLILRSKIKVKLKIIDY